MARHARGQGAVTNKEADLYVPVEGGLGEVGGRYEDCLVVRDNSLGMEYACWALRLHGPGIVVDSRPGRSRPIGSPEAVGESPHELVRSLGSMFQTWSFESDRPFSLEALRQMVRRELPASIYRCKGIVYAADYPDKRLTLQAVGRRTVISELDEWGERTPRTQIVAIGSPIDAQELSNKFDACIEQS